MPSIVIRELDQTTPGTSAEFTDVAYVPGFIGRILDKTKTPAIHYNNNLGYTITFSDKKVKFIKQTGYGIGQWEKRYTLKLKEKTEVTTDVYKYIWEFENKSFESSFSSNTYSITDLGMDIHTNGDIFDVGATIDFIITNYFDKSDIKLNTPILCKTLDEFTEAFGEHPYIFAESVNLPSGFSNESLNYMSISGELYSIGDYEKGFCYAKQLITQGVPVIYEAFAKYRTVAEDNIVNDDNYVGAFEDFSIDNFYKSFSEAVNASKSSLVDRNIYQFKYLTSGGYPTFEYNDNSLVKIMLDMCAKRGDCVALIDHTDSPSRPFTGDDSLWSAVSDPKSKYFISSDNDYGTMFTPWCQFNVTSVDTKMLMPGSFAYLTALAKSLKTNPSWLAVAGVARGMVPNLIKVNLDADITGAVANDLYQSRNATSSINPITYINPYGYIIWGNRTLKNNSGNGNLVATSFLNVRNLVSEIKKKIYTAAKACIFEQNSSVLWVNFKSMITPLLEQMKGSNGLFSYKIKQEKTTEKAKLVATVSIVPLYALEDIDITIVLTDDSATVQ